MHSCSASLAGGEVVPAGHGAQKPGSSEYVPCSQLTHAAAEVAPETAEYLPIAQEVHVTCPCPLAKEPRPHGAQPTPAVPGRQASHADAPEGEDEPAAQAWHLAPDGEYEPAAHAQHRESRASEPGEQAEQAAPSTPSASGQKRHAVAPAASVALPFGQAVHEDIPAESANVSLPGHA